METPRGLTGEYIPTVVKVYDPTIPAVREHLNATFPKRFTPKPHNLAAQEIHAQNKFFHSVNERNIAEQLLEEGRLELDQIESAGLPEVFPGPGETPSLRSVFGELVDYLTHPGLIPFGPFGTGSHLPPVVHVHTTKVAGQTVPSHVHQGSAAEHGEEEVPSILGAIPWLQIAELVGGAALVMFGLVQLGQKAGISVPSPRPGL